MLRDRPQLSAALVVAIFVVSRILTADQPQTQPSSPNQMSNRAIAPVDFTGYWVSVVTEDWRYRMVTPPKGDYASVPLNAEGRKAADLWDPAADEATGNQCKAYGAAAIMRMPGRLHITWENDNTLRIDVDAGTQTRRLRFGTSPAPSGEPQWQGESIARWETGPAGRGGPDGRGAAGRGSAASSSATSSNTQAGAAPAPVQGGAGQGGRQGLQVPRGSLKVVTTHMRPGYLRKNGVPYSASATLTEYFTRTRESSGDEWLVVTSIVQDPQYLDQPFITSAHFRRETNGSKWNPTGCKSGG